MKKYKTLKVFDCTDMPRTILDKFYNDTDGVQNDVYLNLYVLDRRKPVELINPDECSYKNNLKLESITDNEIYTDDIDSGVRYIRQRGDDIIGDWLRDNGASIGEEVIIKCWW
jgi:hypothetical protein